MRVLLSSKRHLWLDVVGVEETFYYEILEAF